MLYEAFSDPVDYNYSAKPLVIKNTGIQYDFAMHLTVFTFAIRKQIPVVKVSDHYSQHKIYITKYIFR
jgi:hypothetical protein